LAYKPDYYDQVPEEFKKSIAGKCIETITIRDGTSGTFQFGANTIPKYKYKEDINIAEFAEYIRQTYSEHYSNQEDNVQAFDLWKALDGDPSPTHRNTAIKYLYRYGKKGGHNRKDILKAMHYCLMLLYYNTELHSKK